METETLWTLRMDDAVVPVVDLDEGDAACVRLVRTACETTGFFFLKGHGVPQCLVEHVFQGGRTFFHQPSRCVTLPVPSLDS